MNEKRFDLFISYSSRDADIVRDIASRLTAMGLRVFMDTWQIQIFQRLTEQLEEGIRSATACLVFYSKHALNSPWVGRECNSMIASARVQGEFKVLVVRLDNTELSPALADWPWIDLVEPTGIAIADLVRRVARTLGVPESVRIDAERGKVWARQAELSLKVLFTLKSLGLSREAFKPIWRISDILRRGAQFPLRIVDGCECGGVVYCGYADMGIPHYRDSYFHICDVCLAHKYEYERVGIGSYEADQLPCCPWCNHVWDPKVLAQPKS